MEKILYVLQFLGRDNSYFDMPIAGYSSFESAQKDVEYQKKHSRHKRKYQIVRRTFTDEVIYQDE